MIVSMTGFGQAARSAGPYRLQIDIRSVNHRYAEIVVRLPREAGAHEDGLKKLLQQSIKRGRVDAYVTLEREIAAAGIVDIDWQLAEAYAEAAERLRERFRLTETVRIADLLRIEGLVKVKASKEEDNDALALHLRECMQDALEQLLQMRKAEGRHLREDLLGRLGEMRKLHAAVAGKAPDVAADYRNRLRERLGELLAGIAVDESRLLTETAIFAEKSNIDEELTRLSSHFIQFAKLIEAEEPPGRRLDFLIQEMNREVNTIGSKANDADIAALVVAMKAELEKMREQVQNIE